MLILLNNRNHKQIFAGTVYVYGNLSGEKVSGMVPTDLIYFKVICALRNSLALALTLLC
jgi:hypothetical protein